MARLRKSCSSSSNEGMCKYYNISLMSCIQYRHKDECELLKRVKKDHRKGASTTGKDLYMQ